MHTCFKEEVISSRCEDRKEGEEEYLLEESKGEGGDEEEGDEDDL